MCPHQRKAGQLPCTQQEYTLSPSNVTGPGKTGLIYTKYTCLYYGTYLLFCMCYPNSVNFIEFLMDFCNNDICAMIQVTDKKLLHFELSKSGQFLHVIRPVFPCTVTNDRCIQGLTSKAGIEAESFPGCFCCRLFLRLV